MARECNIDLEKWELADNIDLYYILQDFEEYFEMKFMKPPVIVKKIQGETASDIRIKKGLPPKISGKSASTKSYSTAADDQGTPKEQR